MNLSANISIKARMFLSFALVLVIFTAFGVFALTGMNQLSELTADLFEHPLMVSTAALRAGNGVVKMHRDMKDVSLSTTAYQLDDAVHSVRLEEEQVYRNLAIIQRDILGEDGLLLQRRALETFEAWKPIRDEVIELSQQGDRQGAIRITRGKGARHVARLERQMLELFGYAQNKADMFMVNARNIQSRIRQNTLWIIGGVFVLVIGISLALIGSIIGPLSDLGGTMEQITSSGKLVKAELIGSNEIAVMASHFNGLVDTLQRQFWYRDGINALNQSLSADLEFEQLLDTAVNTVARYADACFAALYSFDKERSTCDLQATYALVETKFTADQFRLGEGIIGQVALDKRAILLANIDRGDGSARSGTMDEAPVSIYAMPLLYEDEIHGVIEVASFEAIEAIRKEYLDSAAEVVGTVLYTAGQNKRIHALLESTQRANEELEAQAEELQAQTDELKSQSEELEERRVQVEEADRLKSEFLSNMSHELRTPLNSIMALSQLMIERGPGTKPEQDGQYLQVIERNGQQLLNLINDILDLSKIESGHLTLVLTEFDPAVVILQPLETVRAIGEEKGLTFEVSIDPLPTMYSDEDRVSQILINLLSNATKFTRDGSIKVSATANDEMVTFIVRDTGIGIEQDDLQHIFDEFRQVDGSTTREYEGTGLGLAISRKIARILGGGIAVDSEPGVGSTFTLTLPIRHQEHSVPQLAPPPRRQTVDDGTEPSPLTRTVLVVDDEVATCALLQEFLTSSGYDVVVANNGQQAVELALKIKPFAITLDVLMPEIDGFEVLRRLKDDAATADIPVVMVSISENRETAFALGAVGYLVKPVTREALLAEVARVAERRVIERILVVDDDPPIRTLLKALLENADYRVETASGGKEALSTIAREQPDVLILDLMMPEVDGFAVIDALRENPQTEDLPVIVVTAKELSAGERKRLAGSVEQTIAKGAMDRHQFFEQLDTALKRIGASKGRAAADILVVEDNPVAAEQVRSALDEAGCTVEIAAGGADALARIGSNNRERF